MPKANVPDALSAPKKSKPKKSAAATVSEARDRMSGRWAQAKTAGIELAEVAGTASVFGAVRGYRGTGDTGLRIMGKSYLDTRLLVGLASLVGAVWKPGSINPHLLNVSSGSFAHLTSGLAEAKAAELAAVPAVAPGVAPGVPAAPGTVTTNGVVVGSAPESGRLTREQLQRRLAKARAHQSRTPAARRVSRLQSQFGGGSGQRRTLRPQRGPQVVYQEAQEEPEIIFVDLD